VTEALIGRGLFHESDGAHLMGLGGAAEFGAFGIDVGGLIGLSAYGSSP
jgi:hypothetical protein